MISVKRILKKAWYKTEDGRKEMPEYSIESIREIIVNALMHRNYNELGSEVSIDFFQTGWKSHHQVACMTAQYLVVKYLVL